MQSSPNLLSVENLTYYRAERLILHELSFALQGGEFLQVVGPNGSGKSTLLRLLIGLLQPQAGVIRWRGQSVADCKPEYYRQMRYLGHDLGIKKQLTVRENLQLCWHSTMGNGEEVDAVIAQLGLQQHIDHMTQYLSRGQCQRVALARLLLSSASLWILDEPFAALDAVAKTQMERIFANKIEAGGCVIITTHQPVTLNNLVTRTLQLTRVEQALMVD